MLHQTTHTRISSMPVAMLTAYHHAVSTAIDELGGTLTSIDGATLAAYNQKITAVQDYANRVTASVLTPELKKRDEARLAKFRIARNRLRVLADQMDDTSEGSGTQIRVSTVDAYRNVASVDMQTRSGLIRGFIMDVTALPAEVLATSGLSSLLSALGQANDSFEKLYLQRSAMVVQLGESKLKELRKDVNETFRLILIQLEAAANNTDTSEDALKATVVAQNAVAQVSRISREYRTLLKVAATARRKRTSPADIDVPPALDDAIDATVDPEGDDATAATSTLDKQAA